ncbi:MAG: FAD-dependent monooxygenase [Thermomicrobiales bacterium]
MKRQRTFDIVVAGGGMSGSLFAGVMARTGANVLLVEKEEHFRDRIRGESVFPWGVAEIDRLGIRDVFDRAGAVEIAGLRSFENRHPADPYYWSSDSIGGLAMLGFEHAPLQESAIAWAAEQGATILRPAKVTNIEQNNQRPMVGISRAGVESNVRTRLIVGADGKSGASRRWTGGASQADLKHHLLGGVMVAGIDWPERLVDMASDAGSVCYWFPVSHLHTRIFLALTPAQHAEIGVAASFDNFMSVVGMSDRRTIFTCRAGRPRLAFSQSMHLGNSRNGPDGRADRRPVHSIRLRGTAHPICCGTFVCLRTSSRQKLTGGRPPSSLLARELRRSTFSGLYDRWMASMRPDHRAEAGALRDGHLRAIEADPALGGWRLLSARGPESLVADEAARRHFFGEDLL